MGFEPLTWVRGTLTIWHFVVWAAFFVLCFWPSSHPSSETPWSLRLWSAVVMLPVLYCWTGPIVGQIFGQKYGWAQLWPTAFILSGVVSTFILAFGVGAAWSERSFGVALFSLFGATVATLFFGLFFAATSWAMPRVVDSGLIDLPKPSWGVKVYPSP